MNCSLALVASLLISSVISAETLVVKSFKAAVYSSPLEKGKAVLQLEKGKKLESEGGPENGFYSLKTKTGRKLYIKQSDVTAPEEDLENELSVSEGSPSFPRFRFDGGATTGISNAGSFYEFNLGISYYFKPWLSWRNAPFYRFQSGAAGAFGLDSSFRGQTALALAPEFSPQLFLGAGFRLINTGANAPFIEGGLGFRFGRVHTQINVKYIAASLVKAGGNNEVLFTGGVAFGGTF